MGSALGFLISILHLSAKGAVTKSFEIILQQVSTLLIVVGLAQINTSPFFSTLIFIAIAFILHLKAPTWFGNVIGGYMLIMSTALAPVIVYLIVNYPGGFYIATSLHISMYSGVYIFRKLSLFTRMMV